jgi:formate hydrogenlyase subunit 3/multisubunit Na+/H+ antiporter MnhD subunit
LLLGGVAGLLARDPSRPRIGDLSGFGRSNPVALLGLAVALVALVGIPGTPAWAARGAIASASGASAADILVGLSVVAVATALGRLLLVGVARRSSVAPPGARERATGRARLVTIAAVAGLSFGTLAVALGLLR